MQGGLESLRYINFSNHLTVANGDGEGVDSSPPWSPAYGRRRVCRDVRTKMYWRPCYTRCRCKPTAIFLGGLPSKVRIVTAVAESCM